MVRQNLPGGTRRKGRRNGGLAMSQSAPLIKNMGPGRNQQGANSDVPLSLPRLQKGTGRYDMTDAAPGRPETLQGSPKRDAALNYSSSTPNLVRGGAGTGLYSRNRKVPFKTGVKLPGIGMRADRSLPLMHGDNLLDAESVRSENLDCMPCKLPLEVIQFRSEIEVEKIDAVMAQRRKRENKRLRKRLADIEAKHGRVERYKLERERRELQQSWLVMLVHAFSLDTMPKRCEKHYRERIDQLRVDKLAERIQRLHRRVTVKKQWADLSKFYSHISKCQWHLDAAKIGDGCKVVAKFSTKIRRLQRVTRDFLAITKGRITVLHSVLDVVAEEWLQKKQGLLDADATMTSIKVKVQKGNRYRKDQLTEMNTTVQQWKSVDAKFTSLIRKQKEMGRCVVLPSERMVKPLPPQIAARVCYDILHDARQRHCLNAEFLQAKMHEDAKKSAGQKFTVDDVQRIIYPNNGGYIMKVDMTNKSYDANRHPFFCLWSSFKPKSIREVLLEEYEKAHRKYYGDVVAAEMDRRREKAMQGALHREEHSRKKRARRASAMRKMRGADKAPHGQQLSVNLQPTEETPTTESAVSPNISVSISEVKVVELSGIASPLQIAAGGLRPSISREGRIIFGDVDPIDDEAIPEEIEEDLS